jgi:hypothetical protein
MAKEGEGKKIQSGTIRYEEHECDPDDRRKKKHTERRSRGGCDVQSAF